MGWCVYIVKCADGTLYTGATNALAARVAKHNAGRGAKYTRSRRPVVLVWQRRVVDRSRALSLEHAIKGLTRKEKLALLRKRRRTQG